MVGRGELTDAAWERIAPLLPEDGRPGGPWQTCYDRFARWRRDGTWERLLADVQTKSDAVGEVEWVVSVDSTVARAHQHAAGARKRPSRRDEKGG